MTHCGWIIGVCLTAGFLVGCAESTGTTRSLGAVEPALALATAQEVMSQYFSLEPPDPDTMTISARPKAIKAKNDRILGGSPARQIATLRLRREGGVVVAYVSVTEQRQRSQMHRSLREEEENYSGVPDRTPAYDEGATTASQNQTWETRRQVPSLEAQILDDLYKALHPEQAPAPPPSPSP